MRITLIEAGKILKPKAPLTARRVKQLLAEAGRSTVPHSVPGDARIKVGITKTDLRAIQRLREKKGMKR